MYCKLWALEGNRQRLDGGAMFGHVPRAIWSRSFEADSANRIELACRSFLLEAEDGRRVLLEAGVGACFGPKLRARYGVESQPHRLLDGLAELGLGPDDVDDLVLSHWHFDHVGGLVAIGEHDAEVPELLFQRARLWSSAAAWKRARQPHRRDRASFLAPLVRAVEASGRLHCIEDASVSALPGFRFTQTDGHTPGLLHSWVETNGGIFVFASDLLPGEAWLSAPVTMGYDRFAELIVEEKQAFLSEAAARKVLVGLTHDPAQPVIRVALGADAGRGERFVASSEGLVEPLSDGVAVIRLS